MMIEYPKIETLYDRNDTFKVTPGAFRLPEFGNIKCWHVTEKVDGTNIRVYYHPAVGVQFGGRTGNAQIPANLVNYLRDVFTAEKLQSALNTDDSAVTLFGEGYGEKIQNGGAYRTGVAFRLFDVLYGQWWLEPDSIADIAGKLGIQTVPYLSEIDFLPTTAGDLYNLFAENTSRVALEDGGKGCRPEGIVARTAPLLFTRKGDRLTWKLKFKDF